MKLPSEKLLVCNFPPSLWSLYLLRLGTASQETSCHLPLGDEPWVFLCMSFLAKYRRGLEAEAKPHSETHLQPGLLGQPFHPSWEEFHFCLCFLLESCNGVGEGHIYMSIPRLGAWAAGCVAMGKCLNPSGPRFQLMAYMEAGGQGLNSICFSSSVRLTSSPPGTCR